MRYAESDDLRRRIGRQLNKGEDLHALRRFLFFAGEGKMRRRDPEEQGEQALCSNLLTDAVVAWNTVYYRKVLDQLVLEGYPVRDEDVAHLWPTRHAHINPYGKYSIDVDGAPSNIADARACPLLRLPNEVGHGHAQRGRDLARRGRGYVPPVLGPNDRVGRDSALLRHQAQRVSKSLSRAPYLLLV